MFDHSLESSHPDNSNKWSNIEFWEEITLVVSNKVNLRILSGTFNYVYIIRLLWLKFGISTVFWRVGNCFNGSLGEHFTSFLIGQN